MAPAMVRTRCIPTNRWALKAIHDWGMLPGILSDLRPGPGPRAPGGCGNVRAQVSLVPESSSFSSLEGIFIGRPPPPITYVHLYEQLGFSGDRRKDIIAQSTFLIGQAAILCRSSCKGRYIHNCPPQPRELRAGARGAEPISIEVMRGSAIS